MQPSTARSADVTVFGPQLYQRGTGTPVTVTKQFTISTLSNPYLLKIVNNGVDSAEILLNGARVFGPADFKGSQGGSGFAPTLERSVQLHTGANQIAVEVRSEPGTALTVEILQASGDTTPPRITATPNPAPNASGWNKSDVTVTFTCADDVAVRSCPEPVVVNAEGAAQVILGTATDTSGNTASVSVTVNIDKTPPVLIASQSPSPNGSGWNNSPVLVSFVATDALSGVAAGSLTVPITLSGDGANQSVSGQATDQAGNVASVNRTGINIDLGVPNVSVLLDPPPHALNWRNGPVRAHFTCTDSLSGIASCPPDQIVATAGANQTVTGTATDKAGNSMSVTSTTFGIDVTKPTITVALSPQAGASGFVDGSVTAHFVCSDADAGVESCPPDRVISQEGAGLTVSGTVTDLAGNTAAVTSNPFGIDLTPPTITVSLSPEPNSLGFVNASVTAHFTCNDVGSGIASCPEDQVVSTDGAGLTVTGSATDRVGRTASVTSAPFSIDRIPPTIAVTLTPEPLAGYARTPVTVHFTCSDSGSGVASCPDDQVVSTEGTNLTISGTATDRAGNTASATSAPFSLDFTPPVVTTTLTPSPNANGWNGTPVTVHFTCTDVGSGIGSCPSDQTLSGEGANQTVTGNAIDKAGNSASATTRAINIDLTDPTVAIATPAERDVLFASMAMVSGTATDALSGLAQVTCNGAVVPVASSTFSCQVTLAAGANALIVEALDLAGRTTRSTRTVNYVGPPGLSSVNPSTSEQGTTIRVTLTGSNFAAGVTQASFGAGISVGGASEGAFGSLQVNGGSTAIAQLVIGSGAAPGPRTVTVQNGPNQAALTNAFTVVTSGPRITDFTPKSAPAGTLITVAGANLAPNPHVTINRQGGGTIEAPVSTFTSTSLAFVIPPGAVTGPITVAVDTNGATSSESLTVTAAKSFTLSVQPSSVEIAPGQSVSFAVRLESTNGFMQLASLAISGLPPGMSAKFQPASITAGQVSILTVTASTGQSLASSQFTITASASIDGLLSLQESAASVTVVAPTTSLIGRTALPDAAETPLAGVTITMLGNNGNGGTTDCHGSTVSDTAGNFTLSGLGAGCVGPQLVGYDGLTATSPQGKYAGVNLVYTFTLGQPTVSPVLVHLPRIDDKETFLVTQNASEDQSYSYKTIPGLSVTVYKGTRFMLQDGSTPDPFPLVAVQVPVDRLPDSKPPVPTMLLVFIVAFQPANAVASKPVAVYYPNTINSDPGTNMPLLTLDPTLGRMVPYGTATVAPDGRQVVPDLNPSVPGTRYGIVHFDWHGQMPPPPPTPPNRPPVNPPPPPICPECMRQAAGSPDVTRPVTPMPVIRFGDPVDVGSGLQIVKATDLSFGGLRGGISLVRTYRTLSANPGPFGIGTNHNYNYFLSVNAPQSSLFLNLILPEGNWLPFSRSSMSEPLTNTTIPSLQGMRIDTFPDGHAEWRVKDGTIYRFAASGAIVPALESITDPQGNRTTITRNPGQASEIAQITDPVGRSLRFLYDAASRITSITDPIGRTVRYTYNAQGTLETVTDPEGGATRYDYDDQNRLIKETDARGIVVAQNSYEGHGRVAQQIQADGGIYRFDYTFVNPTIAQTPVLAGTVTDPVGRTSAYRFSPEGLVTSDIDNAGLIEEFLRDPQFANLILTARGALSSVPTGQAVAGLTNMPLAAAARAAEQTSAGPAISPGKMSYTYDGSGNVLSETDALGHSTTYTYEHTFNKVTSITDALGHTTKFTYDARGNLLTQTDANDHTTSYTYDTAGQLTQATDALGQSTKFRFDTFGNVMSVTDSLGNLTQFQYDGISRLVEVRDPLGRTSRIAYDRLGRVVKQTDARGGTTSFGYDAVGNLTSLTDARGKKTSFSYDTMSRLLTRTDPLGKSDSRAYDLSGNVTSFTDRRGQTSTFTYDLLDRLIEERYADFAVVKRAYDANGWLVQADDSESGSFRFDYDLAGTLVKSVGPTGAVHYSRDALSRVLTRQVVGQSTVSYAYDPAGNMMSASMPQVEVTYTYDALNRWQRLSRANGVKTDYSFDPAGRLLSIIHSGGTSPLPAQTYSYDAAGRRVGQQSTSAQSLITEPSVASYDDANRLIQRGATSYVYDENGNLKAKTSPAGTTAYNWDSRNRLIGIVGPDSQTTEFKYDVGDNLIRQNDSGPWANRNWSYTLDTLTNVAFQQATDGDQLSILTGAAVDSHVAAIRATGQAEYALADGANSTITTVGETGAVKGQFRYEPFGDSTVSGSTFPFQFTGRVPVSSSLYYYRARFYDTTIGRFISEDLVGIGGHEGNLYRYVGDDPLNHVDPFGLFQLCVGTGGMMYCHDYNTGDDFWGGGHSGAQGFINAPQYQNLSNRGPLPEGIYEMIPQDCGCFRQPNNPALRGAHGLVDLEPFIGGTGIGPIARGGFYIHGGRLSHGCFVDETGFRGRITHGYLYFFW